MSVAELNTFHTICEVERTQLLTILEMSVKNPQLSCFLLTKNVTFYIMKALPPGFMNVLTTSLLYI